MTVTDAKFVAYYRVSTERRESGFGLAAQREAVIR